MEAARALDSGRRAVGRDAWKASQRPRILDAITELVAARGYAGTTVKEIAGAAGVSLSTFYEHFADKEECFLAAYEQVADELFAAIAEETRLARDPGRPSSSGSRPTSRSSRSTRAPPPRSSSRSIGQAPRPLLGAPRSTTVTGSSSPWRRRPPRGSARESQSCPPPRSRP